MGRYQFNFARTPGEGLRPLRDPDAVELDDDRSRASTAGGYIGTGWRSAGSFGAEAEGVSGRTGVDPAACGRGGSDIAFGCETTGAGTGCQMVCSRQIVNGQIDVHLL